MNEDMEREHNKDLLATEQEIEGWKGANRILKAKLEIAEKALEQVSEEMSIVRTMAISEQALRAIRE